MGETSLRRCFVIFAMVGVLALVRCGGTSPGGADAGGGPPPVDGGVSEPNEPPNSPVDAGEDAPDAGSGSSGDGGETPEDDAGTPDAGTPDAGTDDGGEPTDGGDDAPDAATDAGEPDAGEPMDGGGGSRLDCTFNSDCPAAERCECDESTGCMCLTGPRGTGRAGYDPCVTGNDCESALCVEGRGGSYYCSGECVSNADCGPQLPRCASIAFLGRVCIREP